MKYYKLLNEHYGEVVKYDGESYYTFKFGTEEWVPCSFNTNESEEISETNARIRLEYQREKLNRLLNLAIEIANNAHKDQLDKGGNPYILHPTAVAASVNGTEEKIVAYLHDVIEDTDITLEDLKNMGFTHSILVSLDKITKRKGVSYDDYLAGIRDDKKALDVKIADIKHNMDLSRIKNPTEKDFKRIEKYKKALAFLEW